MSELIDNTHHSDPTSRNYRLLLASVFSDRIAFYGLRSTIILYVVLELGVNSETALYYYGFYLMVAAVSALIGGILSDVLSNSKVTMIVGVSLSVAGGLLALIPDPTIILVGMGLVLFGSGFYRTASISYLGHISLYRPKVLERRFILEIGAINVGAFLAAIVIGFMGEEFGFTYSIISVVALYAISLLLVINLQKAESFKPVLQGTDGVKYIPSRSNTKFVILATLGIAFIWFIFDLYGYQRSSPNVTTQLSFLGIRVPDFIIFSLGPLFTTILFVPYYFFAHKIPLNVKLAVGSAMLAAIWLFAETYFDSGAIILGWIPVLLFGLVEGAVDLLVTPTILAFICQNAPKKYFATIAGVYLAASAVAVKLAEFFYENDSDYKMTIPVCVILIAILAFLILVPRELDHLKMRESNSEKEII